MYVRAHCACSPLVLQAAVSTVALYSSASLARRRSTLNNSKVLLSNLHTTLHRRLIEIECVRASEFSRRCSWPRRPKKREKSAWIVWDSCVVCAVVESFNDNYRSVREWEEDVHNSKQIKEDLKDSFFWLLPLFHFFLWYTRLLIKIERKDEILFSMRCVLCFVSADAPLSLSLSLRAHRTFFILQLTLLLSYNS